MPETRVVTRIELTVLEDDNGRMSVEFNMDEDNAKMKHIALLLYHMKQYEQELIDRRWHGCEGYEIIEGDDYDEDENTEED